MKYIETLVFKFDDGENITLDVWTSNCMYYLYKDGLEYCATIEDTEYSIMTIDEYLELKKFTGITLEHMDIDDDDLDIDLFDGLDYSLN